MNHQEFKEASLNPFEVREVLQEILHLQAIEQDVSIPLKSGRCCKPTVSADDIMRQSQSLWSQGGAARRFDVRMLLRSTSLNPFEVREVLQVIQQHFKQLQQVSIPLKSGRCCKDYHLYDVESQESQSLWSQGGAARQTAVIKFTTGVSIPLKGSVALRAMPANMGFHLPNHEDWNGHRSAIIPTLIHYPVEIILLCLRWYLAYGLSLRNLEEMMLERGINVDHSTITLWKYRPCRWYVSLYCPPLSVIGVNVIWTPSAPNTLLMVSKRGFASCANAL